MVFSDLFFLFVFLPAFMLLYGVASLFDRRLVRGNELRPTHVARNVVLVLFSLVFYAWGEPLYVFLMLVCVLINYLAGLAIAGTSQHRKLALALGLVANISILGTFKYLGFLAQVLCDIGVLVAVPRIALPIGISFYVFQSVTYLVDVYRMEAPVQRRYADLLLYISMFPQLIAGPIVRYNTVAEEIDHRHVTARDMADGAFRFLIGLGKKVIIANQFSEIADQFLKGGLDSLSTAGAWIGIVAFTFQIYFDFSGYSDMAIGIGRCLGFHFCENFDHPYCSRSITEFWRRWHMSLGTFFRDYVYIPLGGNRSHQFLNILVVWFLTGMWHGASWNFIIWGLYFGLIVMVEKFTLLPAQKYVPRPLLHIYSLLLIIVGWGIFYYDDLTQMGVFFSSMAGLSGDLMDFTAESAIFDHFWLWITAIIFCMPTRRVASQLPGRVLTQGSAAALNLSLTAQIAIAVTILLISVTLLIGATNNAFLYTRF